MKKYSKYRYEGNRPDWHNPWDSHIEWDIPKYYRGLSNSGYYNDFSMAEYRKKHNKDRLRRYTICSPRGIQKSYIMLINPIPESISTIRVANFDYEN